MIDLHAEIRDGNGGKIADPERMTLKELVLLLHTKTDRILDDHETRLRRVESVIDRLPTVAILTVFVSAITAVVLLLH